MCGCNKTLPSLTAQAGHAAAAAGRVIGAVMAGAPVYVSDTVFESRLEACRACEFRLEKKGALRCTHPDCGCRLDVGWLNGKYTAKAKLATEKCPLGKWPPHHPPAAPKPGVGGSTFHL